MAKRKVGAGDSVVSAARSLPAADAVAADVVYVVNPRGCVHVVTRAMYVELVSRDPRYRTATDEEIARYDSMTEQALGALAGRPFGG